MQIIDGKKIAKELKDKMRVKVSKMKVKPGLAVVLVGNDPASKVYVNSKEKACEEVGFYSRKIELKENISEEDLGKIIGELNKDEKIHGILVQMPLPKQIDSDKVVEMIDPAKDVDCFHPYNFGKLALVRKAEDFSGILAPCTPKGIVKLIDSTGIEVSGKKVVVVGRSNLVGKPVGLMLLSQGATVSFCHSKTINLKKETREADILIAAVGKPKFIKASMVKKGVVIIDVGINRMNGILVGDVDFKEVKEKASFITPVPGGVGPMTIACLLENDFLLFQSNI